MRRPSVGECEDVWPVGWRYAQEEGSVSALVGGVVVKNTEGYWFVAGRTVEGSTLGTLRHQIALVREKLVSLPRDIPPLKEVPLQDQAQDILKEQGWGQVNPHSWAWGKWGVCIAPDRASLWFCDEPIRNTELQQGKVREQLRELLTFPPWKETP